MSRMKAWRNLTSLSDDELRSLIKSCEAQERRLKAPYTKARRSWKQTRLDAEGELVRRAAKPEHSA